MLRIGDFSRISRVSVKALRFYDEIGLLKPSYVDHFTGYRYYTAEVMPRLNRILIFKELGFSLEEIHLLLQEDMPVSQVRVALQNKRLELAGKIAQEQARLEQVESWLSQIEHQGRVPDYEILLKQTPPQWVASMRNMLASYEDAEELFAQLTHHLKKHNRTGQRAAIWHTCEGQGRTIDCEAMFYLNEPVPESKEVKVYQLAASTDALVIHQGSDATLPQAYQALHSWIKTHDYTIAGPIRELYWQNEERAVDCPGVIEIRYPILKAKKGVNRETSALSTAPRSATRISLKYAAGARFTLPDNSL